MRKKYIIIYLILILSILGIILINKALNSNIVSVTGEKTKGDLVILSDLLIV